MLSTGGLLALQISQSSALTMVMVRLTWPPTGTIKSKKLVLTSSKLLKDTTVLRLVKSHFHAPLDNTLMMKVQSNVLLVQ